LIGLEATELTEPELALQAEVRAFLEVELPRGSFEPGLGMSGPKDVAFSKKLAARGWVGMALPAEYGGSARSAVERFIVSEELLRWGAPLAHHWFADRQTGPQIAKFGTAEQKQRFLPPICAGELSFCLGMSEPDAGSDLASVATTARQVDGGWVVNGTKIWTSHAHHHDWMVALVRTAPPDAGRAGLSQLFIPLRTGAVEINPIPFLDGSVEFNEVVLADVFVPDSDVLGQLGDGWAQVTSELVFERGGPDRWLSTFLLVEEFLRSHASGSLDDAAVEMLGWATARWFAIRNLSLALARAIDGRLTSGVAEASLVKEMGTRFELEVLEAVRALVPRELDPASERLLDRLLARAVLTGPGFTIRGGTIEILRSVVARGMRS
jgi:alkylation response protein AidB-like acyl-CoA dehydrogenase